MLAKVSGRSLFTAFRLSKRPTRPPSAAQGPGDRHPATLGRERPPPEREPTLAFKRGGSQLEPGLEGHVERESREARGIGRREERLDLVARIIDVSSRLRPGTRAIRRAVGAGVAHRPRNLRSAEAAVDD